MFRSVAKFNISTEVSISVCDQMVVRVPARSAIRICWALHADEEVASRHRRGVRHSVLCANKLPSRYMYSTVLTVQYSYRRANQHQFVIHQRLPRQWDPHAHRDHAWFTFSLSFLLYAHLP